MKLLAAAVAAAAPAIRVMARRIASARMRRFMAGAGSEQVGQRGLGDGPAVVDMAGDQDGPPFGGQGPEQVAQLPDALRVQAVGGLVEDQDIRVAE